MHSCGRREAGPSSLPVFQKFSLEALEARGKRAYRPGQTGPLPGRTAPRAPQIRTESGRQMKFGDLARKWLHVIPLFAAILAHSAVPQASVAQEAGTAPPPVESSAVAAEADAQPPNVADPNAAPADAAEASVVDPAPGADAAGYTPLGPEWIKGAPEDGALTFQEQYSQDGDFALWMHDAILLPIITVIC